MELYNSEEEQVEALKRWWEKNGTNFLIGLVLILGGVFAVQSWQGSKNADAEMASHLYQQMMIQLESDSAAAQTTADRLVAEFGSTAYADPAMMALGTLAVRGDDYAGAAARFRQVMESGSTPEQRQLARYRLVRVLMADGKGGEGLALIEQAPASGFSAALSELKGDILLGEGRRSEARAAYATALQGLTEVPSRRAIVQMKLDDLAEAKVNG